MTNVDSLPMIRPQGGTPASPSLLRRIHHDQDGSISIISVFAMMILAMLLGMVVNVGLQADSKVKMQNAADAATYSGASCWPVA